MFTGDVFLQDEVVRADLNGSNEQVLVSGFHPDYHPSGASIAYVWVADSHEGPDDILTAAADGSGRTNLTHGDIGEVNIWPAWSPDGTQIAFEHHVNDPTQDGIWVMDSDGSDERLLVPGGLGPDWQVAG